MSDKRRRRLMENLDRCYKVVQQSRTGVRAVEVGGTLGVHRTTAHSYLNTLELMGKVYSEHGLWYPKEPSTEKKLISEESELDRAKAYQILKGVEGLIGPLTREEWDYFNRNNGKSKLDKARALLILKSSQALIE